MNEKRVISWQLITYELTDYTLLFNNLKIEYRRQRILKELFMRKIWHGAYMGECKLASEAIYEMV